jgi:putative hydrolase of the HAD superfamily
MIRNVVFDVGNVFVRWSPGEVIERCFDVPSGTAENRSRAFSLFGSPIWLSLNRGQMTVAEAAYAYRAQHGLTDEESSALFFHVMDHQVPIEGTQALATRLKAAGFRVFGLTDNIREIVAHLKERYDFWSLFEGVVVSADVGVLKPDPRIFAHLLQTFALQADETVFLDDNPPNVEGARGAGMEALLFTTAADGERDLRSLGLSF